MKVTNSTDPLDSSIQRKLYEIYNRRSLKRTFPGEKGMGNTGTSSKHNNTEIWTFTRAHFCLSYATFPSIKIWRKYLERILLCGKFSL